MGRFSSLLLLSFKTAGFESPSRCVTRIWPLLLLTTAPACARPDSPETTLPEPSSPPSSAVPATRVSWSVWDRRTPTSETRPSPREVSRPSSTPLSTEPSPTGTTWRRSGTTPSTMSSELPRGAPCPPDRGPPQPQGQQREDDPDYVRDVQHSRHVRGHPGCALPVRLWSYHRYRARLRRRRVSHRPHLRGLRPAPRHPSSGPGWQRSDRLPDEDPHREGLLFHHHRREGDRQGHQGEAVLRRPGL